MWLNLGFRLVQGKTPGATIVTCGLRTTSGMLSQIHNTKDDVTSYIRQAGQLSPRPSTRYGGCTCKAVTAVVTDTPLSICGVRAQALYSVAQLATSTVDTGQVTAQAKASGRNSEQEQLQQVATVQTDANPTQAGTVRAQAS